MSNTEYEQAKQTIRDINRTVILAAQGGRDTERTTAMQALARAEAEAHEKIDRCEYSGEILAGANTYVTIKVASGLLEDVAEQLRAAERNGEQMVWRGVEIYRLSRLDVRGEWDAEFSHSLGAGVCCGLAHTLLQIHKVRSHGEWMRRSTALITDPLPPIAVCADIEAAQVEHERMHYLMDLGAEGFDAAHAQLSRSHMTNAHEVLSIVAPHTLAELRARRESRHEMVNTLDEMAGRIGHEVVEDARGKLTLRPVAVDLDVTAPEATGFRSHANSDDADTVPGWIA